MREFLSLQKQLTSLLWIVHRILLINSIIVLRTYITLQNFFMRFRSSHFYFFPLKSEVKIFNEKTGTSFLLTL